MRRFSLFVCSLALVACSPSRPVEAVPAAPAPPKPAAAVETRTLTVSPDALRVVGDHVLFEPDRRMQRATYDTYRFDKSAFLAKVGTLTPTAPIRLFVEVIAAKEERYTPSDPHLPSPQGGFVNTTYECRVVKVEP